MVQKAKPAKNNPDEHVLPDTKQPDQSAEQEPQASPVDATAEQDEPQSDRSSHAAQPQEPESPLEALRRERDDLEAQVLRLSADYQNFVRRSQQNIDTACEQQLMSLAKSLVTVLDHFDHALEVDAEKTSAADLLAGMQIVRDELLKTLEQFGIRRLDVAPGDSFDPTYHEALMRQPVDGLEPDRVAAQMQPGYVLGEKALRPAKVSLTE